MAEANSAEHAYLAALDSHTGFPAKPMETIR